MFSLKMGAKVNLLLIFKLFLNGNLEVFHIKQFKIKNLVTIYII